MDGSNTDRWAHLTRLTDFTCLTCALCFKLADFFFWEVSTGYVALSVLFAWTSALSLGQGLSFWPKKWCAWVTSLKTSIISFNKLHLVVLVMQKKHLVWVNIVAEWMNRQHRFNCSHHPLVWLVGLNQTHSRKGVEIFSRVHAVRMSYSSEK